MQTIKRRLGRLKFFILIGPVPMLFACFCASSIGATNENLPAVLTNITGASVVEGGPGNAYIQLPPPVSRKAKIEGVVFTDVNGDGRRNEGEKGLANVPVTDGERIVKSGPDGAYQFDLAVDELRHIYLTLPNGYRNTSPWHCLINPAETNAGYRFDFGLQADPAALDQEFCFLVGSDSHATPERGALLKEDMAQLSGHTAKPRFLINCGDLAQNGWLTEWQWYMEAISALTIPYYNVWGGHEGNYGFQTGRKQNSALHFDLFTGPAYYSWNYGGVHFVVYNIDGSGRQQQWIKSDLELLPEGTPVIVAAHYPTNLKQWRDSVRQIACFYGHWHENFLYQHEGIAYICSNPLRNSDWGVFTRTIRLCRIKDGRLTTETIPCGQYKRIELVLPHEGFQAPRGRLPLRVVALDTGARVMKATAEIAAPGQTPSRLPLEKIGLYTWGAPWDTVKMAPGKYTFQVSVEDDRGETWPAGKCAFTVEPRPLAAGKPGEDWSMIVKSLAELRATEAEVTPPLDLIWSVPTGDRNQWGTSPIVYRGQVYIGIENMDLGHGRPVIHCYDAATGKEIWATPVQGSVRSAPAAAEGRLYAQTSDGKGYCLDAANGKILWEAGIFARDWKNPDDAKCAVIVDQGRVIMYSEYGQVVILDAQTGKRLADYAVMSGDRMYFSGPMPDGERLILSTHAATFCYELLTGKEVWRADTKQYVKRGGPMGVIKDGVYYLHAAGLTAINAADGKIIWSEQAGSIDGIAALPAVADGVVYLGGVAVSARDAKTGKTLWIHRNKNAEKAFYDNPGNRGQRLGAPGSPLVSGAVVYLGRDDGDVIALDKNTGRKVWRFPLGLPIKSSAAVSGNMLFVCDYDGNLYAFAQPKPGGI